MSKKAQQKQARLADEAIQAVMERRGSIAQYKSLPWSGERADSVKIVMSISKNKGISLKAAADEFMNTLCRVARQTDFGLRVTFDLYDPATDVIEPFKSIEWKDFDERGLTF